MTLPLNTAARHLARHSQEHSPIIPELPKQSNADVSAPSSHSITRETELPSPTPKTWLHSPKLTHRPSPLLWGAMSASLFLHLTLLLVPLPEKEVVSSSVSTKKTVTLTSLPQQQELAGLASEQGGLPPVILQNLPPSSPKTFRAPQQFTPQKSPFEKQFDAVAQQQLPAIVTSTPKKTLEPKPKSEPVSTKKNTDDIPQDALPPPKLNDWSDFPLYPQALPGCLDLPSCMRTEDDLGKVSEFFEQELAAKNYTVYPVTTEAGQKSYRISRGDRTEFFSIFTAPEVGTAYVLSKDFLDVAALLNTSEMGGGLDDPSGTEFSCKQFAQPELFCENNVKRTEINAIEFAEGMDVNSWLTIILPGFEADGYNVSEVEAYGGGVVYALEKNSKTTYLNYLSDKDNTGTISVEWNTLPQPLNP